MKIVENIYVQYFFYLSGNESRDCHPIESMIKMAKPKQSKRDVVVVFDGIALPYDWDLEYPIPKSGEKIWVDVFRKGIVDRISHDQMGQTMVTRIFVKSVD